MSKKKSSKKSIKKLHLDKPTSHGGWPDGRSGSYMDSKTPVNKQISKFLSDMGLLDDDNPRARLSEDKIRVKRVVLEGLLKKILQESFDKDNSEDTVVDNMPNLNTGRKLKLKRKTSVFQKMSRMSRSVAEKKFKKLFKDFNNTGTIDFSLFDAETIKYLAVEKETNFIGNFFENLVAAYMIYKEGIPENKILNLNNIKNNFAWFDFYVGDIKEFKESLINAYNEKQKEVKLPGYFIQVKGILTVMKQSDVGKSKLFEQTNSDKSYVFWKDIYRYLNIDFKEAESFPTIKSDVMLLRPGIMHKPGKKSGDTINLQYLGQYKRTGGAGNLFKRNILKVFKDNPEIYRDYTQSQYKRLKKQVAKLTKDFKESDEIQDVNTFFEKKKELYDIEQFFSKDLLDEFYNYTESNSNKRKLRQGYVEPYSFLHNLSLLLENKDLNLTNSGSNKNSEDFYLSYLKEIFSNMAKKEKKSYLKRIEANKSYILDKAMNEKGIGNKSNLNHRSTYIKSLEAMKFYNGVKYLNYICNRIFIEANDLKKIEFALNNFVIFLIDTFITKSFNEEENITIESLEGKNIFENKFSKQDINNITKNILISTGINEALINDGDYQEFYEITTSIIEKIKIHFQSSLKLNQGLIAPFTFNEYFYSKNSFSFLMYSKKSFVSLSDETNVINAKVKEEAFTKEEYPSNDSFGSYPSIVSAMYKIKSGQASKISNLHTIESIFTGETERDLSAPLIFDISIFGGIKISEEPVYLSSKEMKLFTKNIADFYARLVTSQSFSIFSEVKNADSVLEYLESKENYVNNVIVNIYENVTKALDSQTYEARVEGIEELEVDIEGIISIILKNAKRYIDKEVEMIISRIQLDRKSSNYTGEESLNFDETTIKFFKSIIKKEFMIMTDLFNYISYYKEESFFSRWQGEIQKFLIEAIDQNINNALGKRIVYSVFLLILLLNLFDYDELNSYKSKYSFFVSKSYKDFNFRDEIETEPQLEMLPDSEENEQDKDEILGLASQDNNEPDDLPDVEDDEDIIDITALRRQQDTTEEEEDEQMVAESKLYRMVLKDLFEYLNR